VEVLTSTPEEQLASWLFIKWFLEPQNQAKLVRETSAFPLRKSVLEELRNEGGLHPQWYLAADLLPFAHAEPSFSSWRLVRWAVSDAATQLYRFYFTSEQIPELVKFLDKTADDLDRNPLEDSFAKEATPSATPYETGTLDPKSSTVDRTSTPQP